MLTESGLFRNKLATGIDSLLEVRRSDSSTEELSLFGVIAAFRIIQKKLKRNLSTITHTIKICFLSFSTLI